jgi:SAM-dependent methyltransferase
MGETIASGATTIRDDTAERHRNKYANANPLQRLTLHRLHTTLAAELNDLAPTSILDFGCGEGFLTEALRAEGAPLNGYLGVDLRADAIDDARARNPKQAFLVADLFDPVALAPKYDVVLASQVLEHLIGPEKFLQRLAQLTARRLILTVPAEPWFQIINLARGRDLIRLGNHPEHVNHWNEKTFAAFVDSAARVVSTKTVFPFVVVTAEPR